MAKKRNRNVQFLPLEKPYRYKETIFEDRLFQERIRNDRVESNENDSLNSLDVVLNGIRNYDSIDANEKSSSSSLSWGDDYKLEASKKIYDELDLVNKVLSGLEPVPSYYDEKEFKEWMHFFPKISIWGKCRLKPPSNKPKSVNVLLKSRISDKINGNISNRRHKTSFDIAELNDSFRDAKISSSSTEILADQSKSLISSQFLSSVWMKDEDGEFNSLPFIRERSYSVRKTPVQRNIYRKKTLILPPIETSPLRSISATPRAMNVFDKSRFNSSSLFWNSKTNDVKSRLFKGND